MGEDFGPFHEGELAVQRATGERATGAANGRIIADRLVPAAVGFVARQSLAAVASVDADGRPWCSPLLGPPGSFTVPDLGRVALDRAAGRPDDPLWSNVAGDPRAGVIFLEAESRKRFRVNGRVADPDGDPIVVEVAEVFGNCPRYITRRRLSIEPARGNGTAVGAATGVHLGDDERRIIAAADTVFVASANPAGLPDASHRGGRPGFVDVRADRLWIPDYPGNSMFNTLGNLRLNPAAGLLFIDFGASESLQLTGATVLDLAVADADTAGRTGGTGRGWTFTPSAWRRAPLPRRVHADLAELSRHTP
jgi:predicted pyridoxine 5'-phosphate oxidase superfamily flavin-nucleotide-binding protein